MPVTPLLQVENGSVLLGGRPVLRGIDLTIRPGEVVAILGANGSGKSTLVRTILGLVPLRRGSVTLFGSPHDRFREWWRIGFVPQRTGATAGVPASVWEVVAAGRLARRRAWQPMRRADKAAVSRALESVDLLDRAGDRVSTLSGGQQQRVLIARALAGDPELLILDEPTAGVDVASQDTLAAILGRLAAEGRTLVLVLHELGPLAPLITRTVVMRDGRVAYDGEPLDSFRAFQEHTHHHERLTPPADHYPDLATAIDGVTAPDRTVQS